jgi:hypothetical protein
MNEHKLLFVPNTEIVSYEFPEEIKNEGWRIVSAVPVKRPNEAYGIAFIFVRQVPVVNEPFRIMMDAGVPDNSSNKDLLLKILVGLVSIVFIVAVLIKLTLY